RIQQLDRPGATSRGPVAEGPVEALAAIVHHMPQRAFGQDVIERLAWDDRMEEVGRERPLDLDAQLGSVHNSSLVVARQGASGHSITPSAAACLANYGLESSWHACRQITGDDGACDTVETNTRL